MPAQPRFSSRISGPFPKIFSLPLIDGHAKNKGKIQWVCEIFWLFTGAIFRLHCITKVPFFTDVAVGASCMPQTVVTVSSDRMAWTRWSQIVVATAVTGDAHSTTQSWFAIEANVTTEKKTFVSSTKNFTGNSKKESFRGKTRLNKKSKAYRSHVSPVYPFLQVHDCT